MRTRTVAGAVSVAVTEPGDDPQHAADEQPGEQQGVDLRCRHGDHDGRPGTTVHAARPSEGRYPSALRGEGLSSLVPAEC